MRRVLALAVPLMLAATPCLALADAEPATTATDPLSRALARLEAASRQANPETLVTASKEVLPVLMAAVASGPADCGLLDVTATAAIRAGHPADARTVISKARAATCDPATFKQLEAWSLEYSKDGERRGAGADLAASEAAYLEAARLFAPRDDADSRQAASQSLLHAGELAKARGDVDACAHRALQALPTTPAGELQLSLAHLFLDCRSPFMGEGGAFDQLSASVPQEDLTAIVEDRAHLLSDRIDTPEEDPAALAAHSFYSILSGGERELGLARKYLLRATALQPSLPEAWYLLGRAEEAARNDKKAARIAYERQIVEAPTSPATRLAINALGMLLASSPDHAPADLSRVLALLDAELKKTPREAAMHDTRGRVLLALGRRSDARAALEEAQSLEPEPSRAAEIDALR